MPFHIFSLVLTAVSNDDFRRLISSCKAAVSSEPLLSDAAARTEGGARRARRRSPIRDGRRRMLTSCESCAVLLALILSRFRMSMIAHSSLRNGLPTKSGGDIMVDRWVIAPACDDRVRTCWCDGREWTWMSPEAVPTSRYPAVKDSDRQVTADLFVRMVRY